MMAFRHLLPVRKRIHYKTPDTNFLVDSQFRHIDVTKKRRVVSVAIAALLGLVDLHPWASTASP